MVPKDNKPVKPKQTVITPRNVTFSIVSQIHFFHLSALFFFLFCLATWWYRTVGSFSSERGLQRLWLSSGKVSIHHHTPDCFSNFFFQPLSFSFFFFFFFSVGQDRQFQTLNTHSFFGTQTKSTKDGCVRRLCSVSALIPSFWSSNWPQQPSGPHVEVRDPTRGSSIHVPLPVPVEL